MIMLVMMISISILMTRQLEGLHVDNDHMGDDDHDYGNDHHDDDHHDDDDYDDDDDHLGAGRQR